VLRLFKEGLGRRWSLVPRDQREGDGGPGPRPQLRGPVTGDTPTGPSRKAAGGRGRSSCPSLTLLPLLAPPAPTQPRALLQPLLSWAQSQAVALSSPPIWLGQLQDVQRRNSTHPLPKLKASGRAYLQLQAKRHIWPASCPDPTELAVEGT
jgi:hypothetical protein